MVSVCKTTKHMRGRPREKCNLVSGFDAERLQNGSLMSGKMDQNREIREPKTVNREQKNLLGRQCAVANDRRLAKRCIEYKL